jgi:hypothetical protein
MVVYKDECARSETLVDIAIWSIYGCLMHPEDQGSMVHQKADSYIPKSTLLIPLDVFLILVQL